MFIPNHSSIILTYM